MSIKPINEGSNEELIKAFQFATIWSVMDFEDECYKEFSKEHLERVKNELLIRLEGN